MATGQTEFDFTDACAAHRAMLEAIIQAVERKEKMPSSSTAIARHAQELKRLRNKILDGLSERERAAFPDYRPGGEAGRE